MKVDPAALKEIKHISIGVFALDGLLVAVYLGIGILNARQLLFLLGGSLVSVICFMWMCMSIQKTLESGENARGIMTRSYAGRMALYFVWGGVAVYLNRHNYPVIIAGLLPMLMPNITIKLLNLFTYFNVFAYNELGELYD